MMKDMLGKALRLVVVLILALAIGAVLTPQAQQRPYIVCSDIPWDPFEMVTSQASGQEQYFGFDLDVMRAIGILEDYEIEIRNMVFDSIIPAVQAGGCDIGASGFTITAKREQVVDFSDPYYVTNQAVIVRQDSGFTSLDDVFCCSHKIGAQRGTTGADWVQSQIDQGVDVQLVLYTSYPLAVQNLVNGRIDAVVQDELASQYAISAYPNVLTIAGIIETNEYYGFLVAEGDPERLLPKINEGMTKLGLRIVETAAGTKLWIIPDTPWENLLKAYFGPPSDVIEAAWLACKDLLLVDEDVEGFASCMAGDGNQPANLPPQARFTFSPAQPTDLDEIAFTDRSSDPDGQVVQWYWDFGDGYLSTKQNPSHQYKEDGTYTVELTVTDDDGATSSVNKTIKVSNVPPIASFSFSPSQPLATQPVTFDASDSSDPDGNISRYQWEFGDGSSGEGKVVRHAFTSAGTYTVTLTVSDDDGATASVEQTVKVLESGGGGGPA